MKIRYGYVKFPMLPQSIATTDTQFQDIPQADKWRRFRATRYIQRDSLLIEPAHPRAPPNGWLLSRFAVEIELHTGMCRLLAFTGEIVVEVPETVARGASTTLSR